MHLDGALNLAICQVVYMIDNPHATDELIGDGQPEAQQRATNHGINASLSIQNLEETNQACQEHGQEVPQNFHPYAGLFVLLAVGALGDAQLVRRLERLIGGAEK